MKKQIIFYSQGLRYEVELSADKTVLICLLYTSDAADE